MIKLTRLNGEIIYLNYFQILYLEKIPETKVMLASGDYYIVKDSVESIISQARGFIRSCMSSDSQISHV
ncbi:MAG: flagellar FlbD family protein [Eubacterium sp.]|nr:flagellar FlbD family protein [Eubacterium sp.]